MNYEEDIRIDEEALDIEWLEQAELAMKYAKNYAEARRRLTNAEEKIKVIRAELIAEANADPVKCCNKDKPNAADIEAYYRNHRRHKLAKDEWVQAQYDTDIAEAAKNEIGFTRKAALENLVRLHGQQYFAGPSIPHDLAALREQKQKRANTIVGSAMKRNR
jgi:hypothetical protein